MMQRQRHLVLVLTLPFFLSITLGWSQTREDRQSRVEVRRNQSRLAAQADEIVVAEMKAQRVVGVAIGLIRNGKIEYLQGYGFADLEERVPVTRETMFRWASISKTVTAVAAMQLWEKGKLDIEADVRRYVPEFPDKGSIITSHLLLCHTSGIVHYNNGPVIRTEREYGRENPFESVVLALDTFKDSPLIGRPGEKYSYTTHGFILMSAVVERAGGKKFADQVRERIVEPLGMKTLRPDYQWEEIPNRAVGYRRRVDKIVRSGDSDVSWKLGGGGFISNIDDLARFTLAMIDGELIGKKTQEMMFTRQTTAAGEPTPKGLGFSVSGEGSDLRISHGGSQQKTRTHMAFYPNKKIGVVVMCNTEHANPGRFVAKLFPLLDKTP